MSRVGISISATNVRQYRELAKRLRKAGARGKGLRANLRKRIVEAGKPAVDEVKAAVEAIPITSHGGGGKRRQQFNAFNAEQAARRAGKDVDKAIGRGLRKRSGLRRAISSATKMQITAKGIRIIVNSSSLPPSQRSLPRHLDSPKGWRHPVFGTDTWVHQQGKPYFAVTIKKHAPQIRAAIQQAMDETAAEIERG